MHEQFVFIFLIAEKCKEASVNLKLHSFQWIYMDKTEWHLYTYSIVLCLSVRYPAILKLGSVELNPVTFPLKTQRTLLALWVERCSYMDHESIHHFTAVFTAQVMDDSVWGWNLNLEGDHEHQGRTQSSYCQPYVGFGPIIVSWPVPHYERVPLLGCGDPGVLYWQECLSPLWAIQCM